MKTTSKSLSCSLLWLLIALASCCLTAHAASAMEFSIITIPPPDPNLSFPPTVFAQGPIEPGDAERLRDALAKVPRDDLDLKWIALNSGGGSVVAAFEMADVIDEIGALTVVPPGAKCASACAMILFIAGRFHKVLPGGALGLHTCYTQATHIRNELCNERIAEFAVAHGTAYGSVMASMMYTKPEGMVWFADGDADCYGLNRYPEGEEPRGYNQCIIDLIRQACREGKCR